MQPCQKHCLRSIRTEFLRLHGAEKSPGILLNYMRIHLIRWGLRLCISYKLPGAAGTTVRTQGEEYPYKSDL